MAVNIPSLKENNHEASIDGLRLLASFYVVVLHTFLFAGIASNIKKHTLQYAVDWFIEISAYPAVDIFGLISGFVGYREVSHVVSFKSLIRLWGTVVFYDFLPHFWDYSRNPKSKVTKLRLMRAFFPTTFRLYWYHTAYVCLCFWKDLLNCGIRTLDKRSSYYLIVSLFLLFGVYENFNKTFGIHGGYSFIWLIILYVFGAVIKRHRLYEYGSMWLLLLMLIIVNIAPLVVFLYDRTVSILSVPIKPGVLISYHSPTVVASAVIYLFISTRMKIPHCISPFLASLGKSTFSVYIMNINNIVVGLYKNRLSFVPRLSALHQPLYIYGFSALFVVVALLIDHIRRAALTIIKNIAFTIWRNLSRWNPRKISLGFLTHVEKNRI